jgi:hypothetical protein
MAAAPQDLYWLLAASVQKSCCFHHPHVPFFSLFSGKYLELLVKWSLMLADSGTDIPSSQYKVLPGHGRAHTQAKRSPIWHTISQFSQGRKPKCA